MYFRGGAKQGFKDRGLEHPDVNKNIIVNYAILFGIYIILYK